MCLNRLSSCTHFFGILTMVFNLRPAITLWKGVHRWENQKIHNSLSTNPTKWSNTLKQFVGNLPTNCLSVFDHFMRLALKELIDSLANKLTPGLVQYYFDKPLCASYLCSWSTGSTLRKYPCYNVQLRKCKTTNARTIKSANYLHLQVE